ncbi:MAG: hypothetical protein EBS89_00130 [Proteobacteria bacterium]|nr:hypothetical protein [Pseudomonadota bacterium]
MSSRARTVDLYDTTLRDGVQREGLSLSLDDKLRVAQRLDRLGVQYIEGGYPGSNARDQEFFTRVAGMSWQSATIVAFGSSRYKDNRADDDPALRALVNAGTSVVTIVCKNSASQVRDVLGVPLSQNLEMIADSVAFLRTHGKRVFYDAEHFFDGFRDDPDYALECLRAAAHSGAETLVLCDTNGGSLPHEVEATECRHRCGANDPQNHWFSGVSNAGKGLARGEVDSEVRPSKRRAEARMESVAAGTRADRETRCGVSFRSESALSTRTEEIFPGGKARDDPGGKGCGDGSGRVEEARL